MSKKVDESNKWKQRYDIARNNQQSMFKKFSDWYDLFYATVTTKNISPWRSKIFIPIISSKGWNLISKFVGLKPGFEVSVRDGDSDNADEVQEKADKMQQKLEYDYDNPHLDEPIRNKLIAPLVDAVVTGTGIAKVPWSVKTRIKYKRPVDENGLPDLTKEIKEETKYGCNDIIPVNIFNVFVAPTATDLYSAPWIIIKEYKTYQELQEKEKAGFYSGVSKLEKARAESDEFATYKKSRNRFLDNDDKVNADKTLDHVAVYECYEPGRILTYAAAPKGNDKEGVWVELRNEKNPYWHGRYPLVRFQVKQRPYEFWGEGLFDGTERLQAAINDVFNHYMDNWNLSIDGMLMIPETSNINDYVIQPGGEITYSGDQPPQQFKFPEPSVSQVQNGMTMIEKFIEDATISNYATGGTNSSTDKTAGTATGIMRLQEAAGDVISFMRANFQQSIHEVGQMWLSNNQQYMDREMTMKVTNSGKTEMMKITPGDLQGDMELKIDDASMQPMSKEQKRDARMGFIQQALTLKQAADAQAQQLGTEPLPLDFNKMFEDLAEDFGEKNAEKYLISEDEMMEKQMEQQQMAQEQQMAQQEEGMAQQQMKHQQELEKIQAQAQAKQQLVQGQQTAQADSEVQNMATKLAAEGYL